jgi:hypothetical protein
MVNGTEESQIVNINVGGTMYATSIETLNTCPGSFLGCLFSGNWHAQEDAEGRVFIDRDGQQFRHILNFLRTGTVHVPTDAADLTALANEADFFGLDDMKMRLESELQRRQQEKLAEQSHKDEQVQQYQKLLSSLVSKQSPSRLCQVPTVPTEAATPATGWMVLNPTPSTPIAANSTSRIPVQPSPGPQMSPSHFSADAEF